MNVDGVSSHSCNMQKNSSCFFFVFFSLLGAVSIFDSESIIFNLSRGICVTMPDTNSNKEKKGWRWRWGGVGGSKNKRSYANLLTDAISVGNQIRADLNRHRTQNHIRVNLMCMALPSAFILSVPSVFVLCFWFICCCCFFLFTDLENSLQQYYISRAKAVLRQRYISRARFKCFYITLWTRSRLMSV